MPLFVTRPLRCLLIWLLFCGGAATASPLRLHAEPPTLPLSGFVAVFEDLDGRADIEAIHGHAAFLPARTMALRPGHANSAIWLRLNLVNESGQDLLRWLSVSPRQMREVSLFLPSNEAEGWQRIDTGTQHPAANWPVDSPQMLLPVTMTSGQMLTLYIRIVNRDTPVISPVLWVPEHYRKNEAQRGLANGLLLGSLLLMPLIGVLLYLMLQDRAFLFNALAMLTFIFGEANASGYLYYYVWPAGIAWPEYLPIVFRALGLIWHVLFLQTLLDTHKTMPRLHIGLHSVAALMLLSLLCIPLGMASFAAGVVQTTGLFSAPFMALVGWFATRKGIAGARYFTLAFVVLTIGSGLHILAQQFVLFTGDWLRYVLPLSMLTNNVLVLFSAVDRILLLRKEKEASQQALLDSLKMHEAELSAKVKKKTASLRHSLLESRQAKDALTHLLAYISHDLRAPLAGILNAIHKPGRPDAMRDALQQQSWAECRRSIELSVHTQFELIDDLIDYAQGELRNFSLAPVPTYFYAWSRDIVTQTEHLAQKNGNRLQVDMPSAIPPVLQFDPKRLRQVLVNLLANAGKSTHDGTIRWQIRHTTGKAGSVRLLFSIADTGAGIPPEDIGKIFQPFQQGSSKNGGSGLGLGIAQSLIAAMGGQIAVASTAGRGATFSFTLELPVADEADVHWPAEPFSFPEPFGRGKTVLIADSQEMIRDHLAEVLYTADFDVVKAANGTAMLQRLESGSFDLLIAEQFMPDLPSALLPQRLRALGPRLPALLLCSASPCQHPSDWENLPPVLMLKPVRAEHLLETVASLLGRQRVSAPECLHGAAVQPAPRSS